MGILRSTVTGVVAALAVTATALVGGITGTDGALSPAGAIGTAGAAEAVVAASTVTTATRVIGPVLESQSGLLEATFTVQGGEVGDPVLELADWTARDADGGRLVAGGTCAASPCEVSVPVDSFSGGLAGTAARRHTVILAVEDTTGTAWTTPVPVEVDVLPRLSLGVPNTAVAGSTVRLSASAKDGTGARLPGVHLQLQGRTLGSSTWQTVGTVTQPAGGDASYSVVVRSTTEWRLNVEAIVGSHGEATTEAATTTVTQPPPKPVTSKLTLAGLPATSVRGTVYVVTAVVSPAATARKVTFQIVSGRSWRTFATGRAAVSTGRVTTRLVLTAPKASIRAIVGAETYAMAATSKTLSTVTKPARTSMRISGLPRESVQGTSYRVTAVLKPMAAGRAVTFQVKAGTSSWRSVGTARTGKTGAAAVSVRVNARSMVVRAVVAASTLASGATSNLLATVGRIPEPTRDYDCGDFATYKAANAMFRKYYPDYGDVFNLDGDDDMIPCEALPGAP